VIERDAIEFRKARQSELYRLAGVLDGRSLVRDPSPLADAALWCVKPEKINGQHYWGYSFESLMFKKLDAESFRHSRPENSQILELELSVNLKGPCLNDNVPDNPFSSLSGDIIVHGITADGSRSLTSAWHLDKHIRNDGDPEPPLAHPEYHFQHGGKKIRLLADYGAHQILESPRIAHPPLDAVLLVDFILSNYCGSEWDQLRLNSTYKELVVSAQERYWAPYALATSVVSKTITATSPWKAKEIWPQLLIDRLVL
jgi:hypothetical protein